MKDHRLQHKNAGHARKLGLLAVLLAAALVMTGCYMEPDRIVDDNNGLTVGTGGQQFDTVITPTPTVTATPTPTTSGRQQVDWSSWNFGNDSAPNPPSKRDYRKRLHRHRDAGKRQRDGGSRHRYPHATTTSSNSTLKSGSTGTAVKQRAAEA